MGRPYKYQGTVQPFWLTPFGILAGEMLGKLQSVRVLKRKKRPSPGVERKALAKLGIVMTHINKKYLVRVKQGVL